MKRAVRGSILIIVLILLMLMFVMGLTILGMKSTEAKSTLYMKHAVMAKQIAISGMEDARVKLAKDMDFLPPKLHVSDNTMSYTETLTYPGDPFPAGEYNVTIDRSGRDSTIKVTSVGISRDASGNILGRSKITALLDLSTTHRFGTGTNPFYYKYTDWQDLGNI